MLAANPGVVQPAQDLDSRGRALSHVRRRSGALQEFYFWRLMSGAWCGCVRAALITRAAERDPAGPLRAAVPDSGPALFIIQQFRSLTRRSRARIREGAPR